MSPARAACILALAAALVLPGCAKADGNGATSPVAPAPSTPAEPTLEDGVIAGLVVDEEQRPLPGATLAILSPPMETQSAADGTFSFPPVPPGKYALAAARLGFEPLSRSVEVVAGETTTVTLTLLAILIVEAAHTTIQKNAHVKVGNVFVNDVIELVNASAVNDLSCTPCHFVLYFAAAPKEVLVETTWTNSVPVPNVNADVWIYYKVGWSQNAYLGDGTTVYNTYHSDREAGRFAANGLAALKTQEKMLLGVMPGFIFTYEIKPTIFTTFAYGDELPDEFTALPPQ